MFKNLFLFLSLVSSIIISTFCIKCVANIWIIPVSFIASFLSCIILWLLFNIIVTIPISAKKEYNKYSKFFHKLLILDAEFICFLLNIKIEISENQNIAKDTNFMLIQNHRSFIDPLITFICLRDYRLSFISKAENFKKPVVGKFMAKNGCVSLKREDNRDAVKSVLRAINELKSKEFSVGVYPEGSRNKSGKGLLPFKHGCFKIAQRAGVPIIVTTLQGTEKIKKSAIFKRKVVKFEVLSILDAKNYQNTEEISIACENIMLENLDK